MRTNFLIILLMLHISVIFSQEKKTYLDSIFYDTINVYNVSINNIKLSEPVAQFIKKSPKIDRQVEYKDEDNKKISYTDIYFGCFSFEDCKSKTEEVTYFTFIKYENNPYTFLLFSTMIPKFYISYLKDTFKVQDKIDVFKKKFPNSYNYYIKQREHNFRERNEGIRLMDYKKNKSVFFSVDEKTNTIDGISIGEIE